MFRSTVDNHLVVCKILEYIHPDETPQLRLVFKTLSAEKDLLELAKMGCFIPAVKTCSVVRKYLASRGVLNLRMPRFKSEAILFDGVIGEEVNLKLWEKGVVTRATYYGDDWIYANMIAMSSHFIIRHIPAIHIKLSMVINACYEAKSSMWSIRWMMRRAKVNDLQGVDINAANYALLSYDAALYPCNGSYQCIVDSFTADEWYTKIRDVSPLVVKRYPPTKYHSALMLATKIENGVAMNDIMMMANVDIFAKAISIADLSEERFVRLLKSFKGYHIKSTKFSGTLHGIRAKEYFARHNASKNLCKWPCVV